MGMYLHFVLHLGAPLNKSKQVKFTADDMESYQRVNVRRKNTVDNIINQLWRSTFKTEKPFRIRFLGEPAVDIGGPNRALLHLFLQGLARKPSLFSFQ